MTSHINPPSISPSATSMSQSLYQILPNNQISILMRIWNIVNRNLLITLLVLTLASIIGTTIYYQNVKSKRSEFMTSSASRSMTSTVSTAIATISTPQSIPKGIQKVIDKLKELKLYTPSMEKVVHAHFLEELTGKKPNQQDKVALYWICTNYPTECQQLFEIGMEANFPGFLGRTKPPLFFRISTAAKPILTAVAATLGTALFIYSLYNLTYFFGERTSNHK